MDDELVDKIMNAYRLKVSRETWHNAAIKSLKDVLATIDKEEVKINKDVIDYTKLRSYIDTIHTGAVLERLQSNMIHKNIHTNSDLVDYVKDRTPLNVNGIRDIFQFRNTGAAGLKALYTYMWKELNYCPFKAYTEKELNS